MKKIIGIFMAFALLITLLPFQQAEAAAVNKHYTVKVEKLDVREKASQKGKIVGSLKKGTTVFVYSTESGGWSKIKFKNKAAYIASSGLKGQSANSKTPTPLPAVPSEPVSTGNLKGTLTWQYNQYIGTRPDVGAKVFLIPTNFNYTKFTESDLSLFSMIGSIPKNSNLHFSKANGYGQYEISNIPVGNYIAVISSRKTTRNPNETLYIESVLKPILGSKAYETFKLFNLTIENSTWETIEIRKNQTLDLSEDFGYTYF